MEEKKIYIGNLEYGVTEDDLQKAIEDKGLQIKDLKIIKDKFSGRSKGFGFAEFETDEQIEQAISALDGQELKGRKLRVSKAKKREDNRRQSFGGGRFR